MRHPLTTHKNQGNPPGFLDSVIIILVSAAMVIFLLWAASRTIGVAAFENLPGWLRESYHAVWTSVATGAAGIGLAILKVLTRKPEDPRPNYLLVIGITTVVMLILISILPRLFKQRDEGNHANTPPKKQNCVQTYDHSPEKTDVRDVEVHKLPSVLLDEWWGSSPNVLQLFTIRVEYPGKVVYATCSPTDSFVHVMNNDPNQRDRWLAKGMSKNPDWSDNIVTCLGMTNTGDPRKVQLLVHYKEPQTECFDVN